MRQQGFTKGDWEVGTVGDVVRTLGRRDIIALDLNDKLGRATELFKEHGISQMPCLDQGKLAGILTESDLLHHLVSGRSTKNTIVAEVMERKVSTVGMHASSSELPRIFERGEVAIVVADDRSVIGIITKMDLIEMLAARVAPRPSTNS
jgi:cystathionine beta-synthase